MHAMFSYPQLPIQKHSFPCPWFNHISAMAAASSSWFRAFIVVFLLLLMPFSFGMVQGFQQAGYSVEQGGKEMMGFQMSAARKLLVVGGMLDYDDPGANPKHDPRKKPGKP